MGFSLDYLQDLGLTREQISFAASDREQHAADFGTLDHQKTSPDAVVWPESTADVSRVLEAANERGVPVTPFAAGTAVGGHGVPTHRGISLDMTRLNDVLEVRPGDLQMDVEAGVFGSTVNDALESRGLFFPPLPTSGDISTLGGMMATDASGMQTVKYGEVREWVLWLEAVRPDGTVISAGSRAAKTSSGYNLKDLLIGSEGTLAVITRATLKLAGLPAQVRGGRAIFDSLDGAARAVADAVASGLDVARLELIDPLSARMANRYLDSELPDAPMVFFEFHANHGIEEEIEFGRGIFDNHGVERMEVSEDTAAMKDLWEARHDLAFAVKSYDPALTLLPFGDVTVPIGRFPEMLRDIRGLAREHDLLIPCFGHAGDGNVHYAILVDEDDEDHLERGKRVDGEIIRRALDMGGTCTGEHGIGLAKRAYLEQEHGPGAVGCMRSIKEAFDPKGILNPGKVFPDDGRSTAAPATGG